MAHSDRARVLKRGDNADRYQSVVRVLRRVLALNLIVAFAKISLGYFSGAVSILSDGFHSLADASSNVVALVGVSAARRPADADHPYGHRKYETMASVGILMFMLLVLSEVARNAVARLRVPGTPAVLPLGLATMVTTLVVNVFVVRYESREGRRLRSEVLGADAKHTKSDVWTTLAVLVALAGVWRGYPVLDPIAGLVVSGFIGYACWQIAREASGVLADEVVLAEENIRPVVESVPGVVGCEKIRTRGASDNVFVDFHLWIDGRTPLGEAHALSHVVKDKLMARFPEVVDVVIHIEPPHEHIPNPKSEIPNPNR
ncbi:MAG TPA: cation diffusion facilitator family transporter [Vicinamibacterales bacterium]